MPAESFKASRLLKFIMAKSPAGERTLVKYSRITGAILRLVNAGRSPAGDAAKIGRQ
jgi:hypothetical protein